MVQGAWVDVLTSVYPMNHETKGDVNAIILEHN